MMFDKNKLIGIPFKLDRCDFDGADCRGIVCLYYRHVLGVELPFTDGGKILFRNKKNDIDRIKKAYDSIAKQVQFNELKENDIVLMKNTNEIGCLGVCINDRQLLHTNKKIGSCLSPIMYFKDAFYCGYRIND